MNKEELVTRKKLAGLEAFVVRKKLLREACLETSLNFRHGLALVSIRAVTRLTPEPKQSRKAKC